MSVQRSLAEGLLLHQKRSHLAELADAAAELLNFDRSGLNILYSDA
jgi:hypothetical protein